MFHCNGTPDPGRWRGMRLHSPRAAVLLLVSLLVIPATAQAAPTPLSPVNDQAVSASAALDFTWAIPEGESFWGYRVVAQLDNGGFFDSDVLPGTATSTQIVRDSMLPPGRYQWWVQGEGPSTEDPREPATEAPKGSFVVAFTLLAQPMSVYTTTWCYPNRCRKVDMSIGWAANAPVAARTTYVVRRGRKVIWRRVATAPIAGSDMPSMIYNPPRSVRRGTPLIAAITVAAGGKQFSRVRAFRAP